MRRDKIASRILLILSVVHVAAAAPATISQRSLDVTKKDLPSTSGTLPSQGDTSPALGDPQLPPPELGTPQLHMDHPPTSGTPQLQIDLAPAPGGPPSQEDSLLAYGTPQLHNDHPSIPGAPLSPDDTVPGSGTPQSQDETSPEAGPPQLHIDQPPAPGSPPPQEDPLPAHGTPQLHNDQPSTPGAPPSPDDTLPVSGTLQSQDETSPASGDPELHSGPPPELETSQLHTDRPSTTGTPQIQDDMPGTPPSEDDMFESSASRTLQSEPPRGALFLYDAWRAYVQALNRGPLRGEVPGGETALSEGDMSESSASGALQSEPPRGALVLDDAWRAFIQAANQAALRGEVPGGETALSEGDMSESSATRTLQYHNDDDQPPTRGALVSEDDQWRTWIQAGLRGESSYEGSPLYLSSETSSTTSGGPQFQNDSPRPGIPQLQELSPLYLESTTSEGPQFLNDPPRSGIPQLHVFDSWYSGLVDSRVTQGLPSQNDPPPASGTPQLHDDLSDDFVSWYGRRLRALRLGALQQLPVPPDFDSETPSHLEAPRPLDSETPPPLHSETPPPLHSETPPPLDSEAPPHLDSEAPSPLQSETLQPLHSETPPSLHSETPPPMQSETLQPLHSETPPPLHSETLQPLHSETPPPLHSEAPSPLHSETLQPLESEALPSAPETHTLFNDAMRQKLKTYGGVVGAVAGVSVGLAFGVKKLIDDHSHGSQRAGRDLASSGVVGRGVSMHPRPPKNPNSRALAELRNEDLRLLSILTRRALERLDELVLESSMGTT